MNNKFRAWDNENNKYFEPTYKAYEGNVAELLVTMNGELVLRTFGQISHESTFPNRFTIEHHTGLVDKNGKEIYEGDILLSKYPSYIATYGLAVIKFGEYKDTVFFYDGNYESRGVGFYAYLTKVNDMSGIKKEMAEGMVVIGNIHQDYELVGYEI